MKYKSLSLLISLIMCTCIKVYGEKTIIIGEGSLPYSGQSWYYSGGDNLSSKVIKDYWDEGKRITSAAYTDFGWLVTVAANTGYTSQTYHLDGSWPSSWIKKNWDDSYHITALSCSHSKWLIVMSKGSDYGGQSYYSRKTSDLYNWWNNEKPKGQHVTDACYSDGSWTLVTSETKKYTSQGYLWATSSNVRQKIKDEIWDKNYYIQLMEYGGGYYLIFYGTDSRGDHGQTFNENTGDVTKTVKKIWEDSEHISYLGGGHDDAQPVQNNYNTYDPYNTYNPYYNGYGGGYGGGYDAGGSGSSGRTCRGCNGSGRCSMCQGKGWYKNKYDGKIYDCSSCNGTGQCKVCYGKGVIK